MPSIPSALAARFRIGPELWSGSSGVLYEATETSTNRTGVLKIVTQASSWTPAERGRLARELEKQSTLSHPYLATPLGAGIAEDQPWIFRAKLEGESLAQRISRGPIPVPEAVAIAAQLASGLDELHRAGLLQRDLSPGHVILGGDGSLPFVRVIDSGVATRIPSSAIFEVTGKPPYVSPEHAAGKLVSFRSDLYALGSILFEMLTAQPLFSGTTEQVLDAQRQTPPPALTAVAPTLAVPGAITTLLGQLLAKEPRERPFSAQQVRRTLEPLVPEGALAQAQAPAPGAGSMKKTLLGVPSPGGAKRADATEELSAMDLQQAAAALRPPPPRREETVQLSSLDLGPGMPSRPPPVPGSVPPPPSSEKSGEMKRPSLPPPVPPGARTSSSSGGLAVPPAPPSSPGIQVAVSPTASSPGGLFVPPAPPPPAPLVIAPQGDLDYDDLAETNAVSREDFEQRQGAAQAVAINDLAPAAAASAIPAVAPAAAAFAPTQMQPMQPMPTQQGGFGQPAQGGFGQPAQGGFGQPAQGGFGQPAQGAFGQPAQGGFGQAAQNGFGQAAQNGFGQPAQGGFPQTQAQGYQQGFNGAAAGAPSPFGATAMMPQTTMPGQMPMQGGMQQGSMPGMQMPGNQMGGAMPMGGMPMGGGMQQPQMARPYTPDEVPGMRRSRAPFLVLGVLMAACMLFSVIGVGGYMMFSAPATTVAMTPTVTPVVPVAMQPMMPVAPIAPPTTVAPAIATIAPLPPTTIAPLPPPTAVAPTPLAPIGGPPPTTAAEASPPPTTTASSDHGSSGSRTPRATTTSPPPPTTTAPRSGLLASRIGPAAPATTTSAPAPTTTGRLASRLGSAPPSSGTASASTAPPSGGGGSFDDLRARARAAFSAHHYDEAAQAYEQASRLQPSNAGVFAGLGAARLAGGNAAGAVTAYERAVQLQPSSAGYHAALGRAYATAGDRAHARSQYEEALRLDPDNRDAQTGLSRL